MAEEAETPDSDTTLGTSRMEALSDGVIAIAITLLVLEIAVQPPGSPLEQFARAWPSYLGYVVSFLTIGAAWISHNALTERLDRADSILLRMNLLFLLLVAFLPFPTKMVAESLHGGNDAERVAAVVYGMTLLAIRLVFYVMDIYTRRAHLVAPGTVDVDLREARAKFRFAVLFYGIAIVVGLVLPGVAVAFYFGIAVFLVVPFRAMGTVLSRREPGSDGS